MAQKTTATTAFQIFEDVVIRLYDGGVISPAVLERVISAFAQANVDWDGAVTGRAVDGRSLHEIVSLTILPGQPVKSAATSYVSVIEHIASLASHAASPSATTEPAARPKPSRRKTAAPPADEAETSPEPESDSEELLAQLSGDGRSNKRGRTSKQNQPASRRAYNPFVNAQPPRSKKP